ncbi:MAG: hypothetical protein LC781_22310 [Actinobacteria bacterium]|nr:hypothetical protein [Actinomycetota bacterium]
MVESILLLEAPLLLYPTACVTVTKWVHGKRKVVEPDALLGAYELADRVCRVFGCPHYEHLSIPHEVA